MLMAVGVFDYKKKKNVCTPCIRLFPINKSNFVADMSYKDKKIVVIIPARGGSKGVPRKNVKLLNGRPLISYAIKAALGSKYADRVIVSSDDKEIGKIAKKYGAEVPFVQPAELATDTAQLKPVLQYAVNFIESHNKNKIDIVILIQPTSPSVLSEDVDKAIEHMLKTNTNSCVSVCEISERPEWMYSINNNLIEPFIKKPKTKSTRRQDLPQLYRLNGAVYVTRRDVLIKKDRIIDEKSSAIVMPQARSFDINEPLDFIIIESLMNKNYGN